VAMRPVSRAASYSSQQWTSQRRWTGRSPCHALARPIEAEAWKVLLFLGARMVLQKQQKWV
jgi:hypothetical protein